MPEPNTATIPMRTAMIDSMSMSVPLVRRNKQFGEGLKVPYLCWSCALDSIYAITCLMLRLREHRERLGLTVRRLGEISGVHYVAVVRLEGGQLDPRLSTLLKLCKALGVTLDDLVKQPEHKGAK